MVKLLHNFNLHENEVFLCLLVEVNVFDGNLLPSVLVGGQRNNPSSTSAKITNLEQSKD